MKYELLENGNVQIFNVSQVSQREQSMVIAVPSHQAFLDRLMLYSAGVKVQDAFPYLSSDEREFILTGITPEEWNQVFGER